MRHLRVLIPLTATLTLSALAQQPLWSVPAPAGTTDFGKRIVGLGDVDGDGIEDIAVADGQGIVRLISGGSGLLLRSFTPTYPIIGGLGAADVAGDGVKELLIA